MEVNDKVSMEQEPLAPQPTVSHQITVVIFIAALTMRSVAGQKEDRSLFSKA